MLHLSVKLSVQKLNVNNKSVRLWARQRAAAEIIQKYNARKRLATINQSINQSISQSITQSINQSIKTLVQVRELAFVSCQSPFDDGEDAQFEQSLLTYVKKEELSTMKRDTRSLYRYPLDSSGTTVHTQASLFDQLTCCLLCNYSTHVNCKYRQHSTASKFSHSYVKRRFKRLKNILSTSLRFLRFFLFSQRLF